MKMRLCVVMGFILATLLTFLTLYQATSFGQDQLKAFANYKKNIAIIMISLFGRVENTVEKEKCADYQHFFLCPWCFPRLCYVGSFKVGIVW